MVNHFRHGPAWLLLLGLPLATCQTPPKAQPEPASPPVAVAPANAEAIVLDDAAFKAWVKEFQREAGKRGISAPTLDAAFVDVTVIPRVVELDRRQPEFTQSFWRYLDNAVTPARVAKGRALMQQHAKLLAEIERKTGVPGRYLVAFWGLESNYGGDIGSFSVVGALATLAFEGRRGPFFRSQLIDALTIIDRGHITPDAMRGSWAGAMGQTQFMPSVFLKHATDHDGDGRIDIWRSVPDALASAGHYLQDLGWDGSRSWGREVRLPQNFDLDNVSIEVSASEVVKPLSQWAALGVRRADGGALPTVDVDAALILPAGTSGPAFLVYPNYRAILKWNRSTLYAIAVGHLADRLVGGGALMAARNVSPALPRADVVSLQEALIARGFLKAETADGVMGSATRNAVRAAQRQFGFPPDGFVDGNSIHGLLAALKARA